jgi:Skp family chaperone for outer membrane proteins
MTAASVSSRRLAALVAALVLALPLTAAAQSASLKVGIFDKQRIVDESKLGLAAKARFEKLQAEREVEVNAKQKALEELQQSLQQKAPVLSDDKRLDLQREVARARDEWQAAANTADRDLQRAYNSALAELVAKIDPVITDYGEKEGFDLLFDKAQCAFNRPALDVTESLLARLNAQFP